MYEKLTRKSKQNTLLCVTIHQILLYHYEIRNSNKIILFLSHRRIKSTFCGLYDISYHNSWIRSRKVKGNSSKERGKFPLQFEPIFITIQCTSQSQDFFKWKMIKKSSNWQHFWWLEIHYFSCKLAIFDTKTL